MRLHFLERTFFTLLGAFFLGAFFAVSMTLGISSLMHPLVAEDLSARVTLYCQNKSLSQVFEACEEIQVLEFTGTRVRAYSKPKQQVLSLKPETIFVARLAASGEKLLAGEQVSIASGRIWNTSRTGFLGLCSIQEVLKDDQILVECGRYRNAKISQTSTYRLRPMKFSIEQSKRSSTSSDTFLR